MSRPPSDPARKHRRRTLPPEPIHRLIAHNVRWLRFMRGWTQTELAQATGLHRSYVSEIERAQCNLRLDNIQKLADGLGVPVIRLFDPTGVPPPGEDPTLDRRRPDD